MSEKLNLVEILKDCPTGMELDCTCADNVAFDKIIKYNQIKCVFGECRESLILDKYGRLGLCCPKCVIFPKGKTTWEGFQRPFKDGDVVFYDDNIAIFKEWGDETLFRTYIKLYIHRESIDIQFPLFGKYIRKNTRFATEEEKKKLFDAIKANGYKWDSETKTLGKLIEPKFKVGDRIVKRNSISHSWIVSSVSSKYYGLKLSNDGEDIGVLPVSEQDDYELLPNKFDITTLKPFDKVLVRCGNLSKWSAGIFSHTVKSDNKLYFIANTQHWEQCIPYEGNEYLCGTTDACSNYFKTWK